MEDSEPATGTPIYFSPIYGADDHVALCYVVQVNGITLLLDCGWTDDFDIELLAPLELQADALQAVLLSHSSIQHLGALPYLVSKLKCNAEVLATLPVQRMGQLNLYDALTCKEQCANIDAISLDDVDLTFDSITSLRYMQRHEIPTDSGEPLIITPFPSGHDVGGTIWSIRCGGEEVVFASDWTQRTDGHVGGADISSVFYRPSLFIADAMQRPHIDFEQRDRQFLQCILNTLRADGNVLIPCNTTGRCLELLLLLERHWSHMRLPYALALCTSVSVTTVENTKAMMEYMKEVLLDELHVRENPWALKHVRLVSTTSEISALSVGPKVVLASLPSLSAGPARQLFVEWAGDPRNAIILPGAPQAGTLAEALALVGQGGDPVERGHAGWRRQAGGRWEVDVELRRRVVLTEEEIAEQEQAAAAMAAAAAAAAGGAGVGGVEPMQQDVPGGAVDGANGAADGAGAVHGATGTDGDYQSNTLTTPVHAMHAVGAASASQGLGLMGAASVEMPTRASSQVIGKLIGGDVGAPQLLLGGPGTDAPRNAEGTPGTQKPATTEGPAGGAGPLAVGGVLLDGFELPVGAAHPLFPFEDDDEGAMVDEYGADLGARDFAQQDDEDEAMLAYQQLEVQGDAADALPTKITSQHITLTLAAAIHMFDYDNLVDTHSLTMFLQSVAPQHLVLVAAPRDDRDTLASRCGTAFARAGVEVHIHTPDAGDVLDCSAHYTSQQVLLHTSLPLELRKEGPRFVTWVGGTAVGEQAPLRLEGGGRGGQHGGVFIGEAKLSQAKAAMDRAGIGAEFARGGALVCTGGVNVLSSAGGEGYSGGELLLEGPLGRDFYAVRNAVYGMYHIC